MKGRSLFKFFRPLLNLMVLLFRFMPFFIISFLWDLISPFGGKISIAIRFILLKAKANSLGDNVYVGKYVEIKNISKLDVGSNVSIHNFCYIDAAGGLEIGDNVSIAHNVSILTTNHSWNNLSIPIKYNKETFKEVIIKDDVWIGCGVRILSGVIIETRCVVAAGAVVNKSFDRNSLVGGVPAKLIKQINGVQL